MPDAQHLLLFVAAGWLLNLTPGPDVLYIVSNSLRSGVKAGLAAGLGITAGCFVHVFAAALGVSALLAMSATAFTILKWVGAAYLLWVGAKLLSASFPRRRESKALKMEALDPRLRGDDGVGRGDDGVRRTLREVFTGGFLTNVLNPKVAIFFLAFVPQFIAPDAQDKALVFIALGALFNLNSLPVNAGWALAAAWMARHDAVQRGMHWLDRAAGLMFVGFGVKLALSDNPTR